MTGLFKEESLDFNLPDTKQKRPRMTRNQSFGHKVDAYLRHP